MRPKAALSTAKATLENGDIIAQTLAAFAPKEKSFPVKVGPLTFHFRHTEDYEEIATFKAAMIEFAVSAREWRSAPETAPAGWRVPKDDASAAAAFTIAYYSAEPTVISQKGACDLLGVPWVLETLLDRINDAQSRLDDDFAAAVDAAKKDSSATAGGSSGSS